MKREEKLKKTERKRYQQSIKDEALTQRELMNITLMYEDTKSSDRQHYEEFVTDKKKFQIGRAHV